MCACDLLYPVHFYVCIQSCIFSLCLSLFPFPNVHESTFIFIISAFHLPKCVWGGCCVVVVVVVCVWWWWCVCVQYVYVKCMCSVRLFVCMHTRVCVSCACGLFFMCIISCTCMFLPFFLFFFLMCVYELTLCAFTFMQVITSSSSSFRFFSVFIYACARCIFFSLVFFFLFLFTRP